ncbi:MAG TPA: hypothetical protein VKY65_03975 [Alphaproteobacteria bacterium]|nr:hypothetical protein [Alphaproteobacteria bacterium]
MGPSGMRVIGRAIRFATLGVVPLCAALAASPGDQTGPIALPKPPYTIKCFQDRDLVVTEDLAARPIWKDGQWQGRRWSGDPQHPGPEILIQPGGNGTCIVRQNER